MSESQMCAWCARSYLPGLFGPVCGLACSIRRSQYQVMRPGPGCVVDEADLVRPDPMRRQIMAMAMGWPSRVIPARDVVSRQVVHVETAQPTPVRTAFVFEAAAVDSERSRDADWALEVMWDYGADVPEAHGHGPTRVQISLEEYRRVVDARAAEASTRALVRHSVVDSERTSLEDWAAAVEALIADVWRTPPDA